MFKKKGFLAAAVVLFFLLPVFFGCENDVKDDDPPVTDPGDPGIANPFIGVWKETDEKFWQFKTNGTGGTAETEAGPFRDDFSFFVYISEDAEIKSSLVLLTDTLDTNPVEVTRYTFSIVDGHHAKTATLTPAASGADITLEQVDGSPQALSLKNPLIGEWATKWTLNGTTWMPGTNRWSLKYRADGTVMTYHHSAGHQFENAYALRGNTLVIYGQRRFASDTAPITAEIIYLGNGTWRVKELVSNFPAQNNALVEWIYTKVDAAKWKDPE